MVRHIENLWHSQNSLLSHFQAFSGTFSNMQPYSGILSDIKVGLPPSKKNYFIYVNDSPLKWMKNGFTFILKALFILKILKFLS